MTNFEISDSENVMEFIKKPDVSVNDTIEIMSNNQMGYKKISGHFRWQW